ncbi:energy transducer TonB [Massilia oculi]|uniref:energy transducer TonB n=1 Tax=Massilia oculi TaxID=945844 RepID=UPI001AAE7472|nr:energy transducer TonB [Massilia oculi]
MMPVIRLLAAAGTAAAILAGCAQSPSRQAAAPADATQAAGNHASCSSSPVYPEQAKANKVEGITTVGFLVGPDGKVVTSRLIKSSGDASLDEAARSALSACTFKPAMREGKPVPAWTAVQYVWKMD